MRFVELEEARAARGLRVVVVANVPSPWSQAALGTLDLKGLDYLAVRLRRADDETRRWTGARNAPVVLFDDEPPRTGWAEILALAERLGGHAALVPDDDATRVRMFGLSHEILGEGGLGWSVRLLLTHLGLETDGQRGWPRPVADYLAPRYGYAPERVDAARVRALRRARAAQSDARREPRPRARVPARRGADGARRPLRRRPGRHRAAARAGVPDAGAGAARLRDARRRRARGPSRSALLAHRALMYARHLVLARARLTASPERPRPVAASEPLDLELPDAARCLASACART